MVGDARLSTHDLTWRSTYRVQMDINTFKDFQLTTSHGGRRHHTATAFSQFGLSTHDLTWRSTTVRFHRLRFREPFNSRPHMEVDHLQWYNYARQRAFNSRPHMEVDRFCLSKCSKFFPFNSRPHMEVDIV